MTNFSLALISLAWLGNNANGFTPSSFRSSSSSSTALFSKDNDRARMEKEWEDAMGDSWRVFRAKLIAQEKAGKFDMPTSGDVDMDAPHQTPLPPQHFDQTPQYDQGHLYDQAHHYDQATPQHELFNSEYDRKMEAELLRQQQLFREFHKLDQPQQQNHLKRFSMQPEPLQGQSLFQDQQRQQRQFEQQERPQQQPFHQQRQMSQSNGQVPNLNGEGNFGGFFNDCIISVDPSRYPPRQQHPDAFAPPPQQYQAPLKFQNPHFPDSTIEMMYQDPFASQEELPCLFKPRHDADVDKHRWAHPIGHIEVGSILVANERLGGVYHQTVVLIVDHHEKAGTCGVVINRPQQGPLKMFAEEDDESNLDSSTKRAFAQAPVTYGGPKYQNEYALLHGYGNVEGSKKVAPGIFIGGMGALTEEAEKHGFDPTNALFIKGHIAWGPGELKSELDQGGWYLASASSDLVLRYAGAPVTPNDNPNDLWSDILNCMGGEYADVARMYGGQGDKRLMP